MNNSTLCESDFYKVEDLKFDILKLRKALKQVLSRKEYDDAVGTKYIAGISLNQIPGEPDSIRGENVKGIYWTKPDGSGKEAVRAKRINETKYTEFVKDLEDTYFKEVVIFHIVCNPSRTICWKVFCNFFDDHNAAWISNNGNMKSWFWISVPT